MLSGCVVDDSDNDNVWDGYAFKLKNCRVVTNVPDRAEVSDEIEWTGGMKLVPFGDHRQKCVNVAKSGWIWSVNTASKGASCPLHGRMGVGRGHVSA